MIMRKFIKAIALLCVCMFNGNANAIEMQDTLRGKTIIVVPVQKIKPVDTGYVIEVEGKTYTVWKGPKGGMYYIVKGKKVYLTKKQKALIK